jgi:CheY-like chemotaxis protein
MAKRILLVDDSSQVLDAIHDVLEARDYEVVVCDEARDAVETARELRPDLILLDVNMPGMNGWEVLEVLRLNAETRSIPIVINSADFTALQQRETFLRGKGVEVLYRPFDVDELYSLVERLIGAA